MSAPSSTWRQRRRERRNRSDHNVLADMKPMLTHLTSSDDVVADHAVFSPVSPYVGSLLHEENWPLLPRNYYRTLGERAIRWGGSKSQKYAVKAFPTNRGDMSLWARYRFEIFMEERSLCHLFRHAQSGELANGQTFEKYEYVNYVPFIWMRFVYHGTFAETFCRIAHTGKLSPSQPRSDLGHECRTNFPCVFTAENMQHAIRYTWPSNFLKDKLYYGVLLELAIDSTKILEERRGEVLVPPEAISIKALYLLTNMDIAQGAPRSYKWDPSLELLPAPLVWTQGTLLRTEDVRPRNLY